MTRDEILEKMRKVEALFQNTNHKGEANAALDALGRLSRQLTALPEEELEFQISLPDPWKRQVFCALARKMGLEPFRRYRQKYSTVMIKCGAKVMNEVLWPQFEQLSQLLSTYLKEATEDIIASAIHSDTSEATEKRELSG
jgi:tRNA nucleotidyltransferase (CCA-adding enzyme)